MPQNKNAIARYIILDELLQNKYGHTISQLTGLCNDRLEKNGQETVSKRCIEKDLNAIEGYPFYAEIDRSSYTPIDYKNGKPRRVQLVRYTNPYYSIFNHELNDDEKALLRKALEPFGKFEDIPGFEQIEQLIASLNVDVDDSKKFVYYSVNEKGTNTKVFGKLYSAITEQKAIDLTYHTFSDSERKHVLVHPYLLKEWNRRWYLIAAAADTGKILTFALDRTDDVETCDNLAFVPPKEDLIERFEDIVGITYFDDAAIETIYLWVSDKSFNYLDSKPIHGSQTTLKERSDEEVTLRQKRPDLKGGKFVRLECMINYELVHEILAYGKGMVVLSPTSLRYEIIQEFQEMMSNYTGAN